MRLGMGGSVGTPFGRARGGGSTAVEKPRRPIAVTSRGSSRRRAMTRARSGRLSGLTLVVALLEHARNEGTTHPVVVHEQHVHVSGRRARHRRAPPSDVTRLRKNNRRLARRWRRAARRRARFARSRNGAPRRVPALFPTRPFGVAAPNSTGRRVLAALRPRACVTPTNESSPPSQSLLTVPGSTLFLVRASPEQTDVAQPAGRVPILCIWLASIPDEFRRVLFGLQNSVFWTRLFFFREFSAWVGGSTVEKPDRGSDVALRCAGGRDWLKKNHRQTV